MAYATNWTAGSSLKNTKKMKLNDHTHAFFSFSFNWHCLS